MEKIETYEKEFGGKNHTIEKYTLEIDGKTYVLENFGTFEYNPNETKYNPDKNNYDIGERIEVSEILPNGNLGNKRVFYYHQSNSATDLSTPTTIDTKIYAPGSSTYSRGELYNYGTQLAANDGEVVQVSDYYADGSKDYNFIACANSDTPFDSIKYNSLKVIEHYLEDTRNIKTNVTIFDGFSLGGDDGLQFAKLYLGDASKNNENPDSLTLILNDPYGAFQYNPNYLLTEDDLNNLKTNNAKVIGFIMRAPTWNRIINFTNSNYKEGAFMATLVNYDIETILISIKEHSTKNEYNNGWISYFDGYCELNDIVDTGESVYIPTKLEDGTVKWTEYTLASLQHPDNYENSEELKKAIATLENFSVRISDDFISLAFDALNELKSFNNNQLNIKIKYDNSSLLLPKEQETISNINAVINSLILALESEVDNMINAGREYCKLDRELKENTEILGRIRNGEIIVPSVKEETNKDNIQESIDTPSYTGGGYSSYRTNGDQNYSEGKNDEIKEEINIKEENNDEMMLDQNKQNDNLIVEPIKEVTPSEEISNQTSESNNTIVKPIKEGAPVEVILNQNNESNNTIVEPITQGNKVSEEKTNVIIENSNIKTPSNNYEQNNNVSNEYINNDSNNINVNNNYVTSETIIDNPINDEKNIIQDFDNVINDNEINNTQNNTENNSNIETKSSVNGILGTIGAVAGVAGVTAAGVYGTKKYIEKKKENEGNHEEDTYGTDSIPSLEEQYSDYNKPKTFEEVDFYKSSKNNEGEV